MKFTRKHHASAACLRRDPKPPTWHLQEHAPRTPSARALLLPALLLPAPVATLLETKGEIKEACATGFRRRRGWAIGKA